MDVQSDFRDVEFPVVFAASPLMPPQVLIRLSFLTPRHFSIAISMITVIESLLIGMSSHLSLERMVPMAKKKATVRSTSSQPLRQRTCGAMQHHQYLLETNPTFRANQVA